jgi:hypothetical protein
MGLHTVAGAESLTIQIHALPSVGTSSTVHFGSHGIPALTVNCAKVARANSHRLRNIHSALGATSRAW